MAVLFEEEELDAAVDGPDAWGTGIWRCAISGVARGDFAVPPPEWTLTMEMVGEGACH